MTTYEKTYENLVDCLQNNESDCYDTYQNSLINNVLQFANTDVSKIWISQCPTQNLVDFIHTTNTNANIIPDENQLYYPKYVFNQGGIQDINSSASYNQQYGYGNSQTFDSAILQKNELQTCPTITPTPQPSPQPIPTPIPIPQPTPQPIPQPIPTPTPVCSSYPNNSSEINVNNVVIQNICNIPSSEMNVSIQDCVNSLNSDAYDKFKNYCGPERFNSNCQLYDSNDECNDYVYCEMSNYLPNQGSWKTHCKNLN